MSELDDIRQALPDSARDIRLNLGSMLGNDGLPELSTDQKWGAALASAIAARNLRLTRTIEALAGAQTSAQVLEGARIAASIMAMTNVYYRAMHMAHDAELAGLPAGLRMNGLAKHGIDKADFELFELAASVVKGCESCTRAHVAGAKEHGVTVQTIQAVIRLAAVLHATATVLDTLDEPALAEVG
ncbi:carboxymuconolactone decarboxylase family protein [Amorphus sp. 3PC139-8]|uniref:carboxymuconolactone decarboxylase family protein n=1 Tax=Amorphus sp. 3PC139-8 TaxID=2735676 RepID=UPI00345D7716